MLIRKLHRLRKRSFNVLWEKKDRQNQKSSFVSRPAAAAAASIFSFRVSCGNSFIITSRTKIVWSALLAVSLRKCVQFKGCSSFAASRRR